MTGYAELGVVPLINASAALTRLGGSRMAPEVVQAMAAAASSFVDLNDLQRRVGARITGTEPARVVRLPAFDGEPPEVIIHRGERNGYDHAARQTGARSPRIAVAPVGSDGGR